MNIFERLKAGEASSINDLDYGKIREAVNETFKILVQLNSSGNTDEVRICLSRLTGVKIDDSTTVFPPFHTNFGRFISLGKNVFINHGCSFLDLGGIIIEDDVMIGPGVKILSEDHPVKIATRKTLVPKRVHIHQNVWIGAAAIILPGVSVGENSVVAAGALVTKDIAPNTVVAGVPAKLMKEL